MAKSRFTLPKIFSGIKVLDFSRLLPGPFASELLIQLGAEVTCVLPPKGDPLLGDYSPFEKLKAGKNFITIDLKNESGFKQATALLSQSDILLEGFRPGTLDKLRLGYKEAVQIQKNLLYVSITGYEEGHPKHSLGAHDLNFLIDSGVYTCLFPDDSIDLPLLQIADLMGGFYAVFQILIYWIQRWKQPGPHHIKVSIVEGLKLLTEYLDHPSTPELISMLTGGKARYRIYRTRDQQRIMVGAIEPKFFDNLLGALDIQLGDDIPEPEVVQKLEEKIGLLTLKDCQRIFEGVDACISYIPSRQQLFSK